VWPRIQNGGRLFKLVCSSFVDVGKLQKLWKIQNFETPLFVWNYDIVTNNPTLINEVNHWAKIDNITANIRHSVQNHCLYASACLLFWHLVLSSFAGLTIYSHWESQVAFSQRSHTSWRKFVVDIANCIKSPILHLPHPVIDTQISISKIYERYSN